MNESTITIDLDDNGAMVRYLDIIAGLVQRGILFKATVSGPIATITTTGGF